MKPGDRVTYYRDRKPHGRFAATFIHRSSELKGLIELDEPYGTAKRVVVLLDALEPIREIPKQSGANALAFAQIGLGYR